MPYTSAVEVVGLRRSFGATPVLDGIDLQVPAGTVFALLGPNGAGKTTTVRILATLLPPDAGSAQVAGYDVLTSPERVRSRISLTGQFAAVDSLLTGEENLLMTARLCHLSRTEGRQRVRRLLDRFELTDAAARRVKTYSGGMRRKLDLAMGLVGDPQVVFLDEPTTGLDPRSRQAMWAVIEDLVDTGVTIFLTTQYLEEADRLADRIAVLDHGRVIADGTAEELKRRVGSEHVELVLADPAELARAAEVLGDALVADGDRVTAATDGSAAHLRSLLDRMEAQAIEVARVSIHRPSLDDVFLSLVGQPVIGRPPTDQPVTDLEGAR